MWALATLDMNPGRAVLDALAKELAVRAAECKVQECCNAAWGLAKLGTPLSHTYPTIASTVNLVGSASFTRPCMAGRGNDR